MKPHLSICLTVLSISAVIPRFAVSAVTPRAILILAAIAVGSLREISATESPSIVIILADDIGYGDLGCYGSEEIQTPHIDQLAESGIRLIDGYVTHAYCGPSSRGSSMIFPPTSANRTTLPPACRRKPPRWPGPGQGQHDAPASRKGSDRAIRMSRTIKRLFFANLIQEERDARGQDDRRHRFFPAFVTPGTDFDESTDQMERTQ